MSKVTKLRSDHGARITNVEIVEAGVEHSADTSGVDIDAGHQSQILNIRVVVGQKTIANLMTTVAKMLGAAEGRMPARDVDEEDAFREFAGDVRRLISPSPPPRYAQPARFKTRAYEND